MVNIYNLSECCIWILWKKKVQNWFCHKRMRIAVWSYCQKYMYYHTHILQLTFVQKINLKSVYAVKLKQQNINLEMNVILRFFSNKNKATKKHITTYSFKYSYHDFPTTHSTCIFFILCQTVAIFVFLLDSFSCNPVIFGKRIL